MFDYLFDRFNMLFGIAAVFGWGLIVGVVPLFLFFEIYHWVLRKKQVSRPLLKGILAGVCLGVVVTYLLIGSATGALAWRSSLFHRSFSWDS